MPENLPTPGNFVDTDLDNLFQESINQLISDLRTPVKLIFEPSVSGCPNCFAGPDGRSNGVYDSANPFPQNTQVIIFGNTRVLHRPFPNGGVCYVCQGSHKIKLESSQIYNGTVTPNPKDFDIEEEGRGTNTVYKVLTQSVALDDVKKAQWAQIQGDRCVLIRDPVKTGLKSKVYIIHFWEKQD